ncbi:hypothetical protein GCM10028818_09550 [Spirosoma horti]
MRIGNPIKKKMNGKDNSEWTYPQLGKDVCNRTNDGSEGGTERTDGLMRGQWREGADLLYLLFFIFFEAFVFFA